MGRAGFTIIELLVASAIMAVIMVFTLQTFTVNNRSYTQIDSVVESQQSVRVISSMLERDLRHAGFFVPEGAAICAVDNDTDPDVLFVSDHTAVEPGTETVPFSGAQVQGSVSNVAAGTNTFTVDSVVLETGTPDPSYDNDGNGTNESDFLDGGGVIVTDLLDSDRGAACGTVTAVNAGSNQVTFTIESADLATAGGAVQLTVVPAIIYRITAGRLLRNGLLLSEGIEDLQFAFFFDDNGDNLVDAGEMIGDGTGSDYDADDEEAADLREVRFNMVVRSRREDDQFTRGYFQAFENRTAVAGTDGFRRRTYTNTVRLRNVGSRVEGT